ncbi:hypothetical protein EQG41_15875 [Billgrantia azerbaijanica]|nr:hypothetical protein EQG41_15875 [Halomonas azerbaijanica]
MADLFGTKRPAITKHLGNIFRAGELDEASVCSILERAAADGKQYKTKLHSLDAIISVGYRVNSMRVTQFRHWATSVLPMVDGYACTCKQLLQKMHILLGRQGAPSKPAGRAFHPAQVNSDAGWRQVPAWPYAER